MKLFQQLLVAPAATLAVLVREHIVDKSCMINAINDYLSEADVAGEK